LNYRPRPPSRFMRMRFETRMAGREGIEPSLRGLESRLVTMTLRPVRACSRCSVRDRELAAPRTGIEPSLHSIDSGAATPVASRGILFIPFSFGVLGSSRPRVRRFRADPLGHEAGCLPRGHERVKSSRDRGSVRESHPPPLSHNQPSSLDE